MEKTLKGVQSSSSGSEESITFQILRRMKIEFKALFRQVTSFFLSGVDIEKGVVYGSIGIMAITIMVSGEFAQGVRCLCTFTSKI